MNQRNRIIWLDALRAFLALGVAFKHAHSYVGDEAMELESVSLFLMTWRVPCFLFMSGFLGWHVIEGISVARVPGRVSFLFRRLVVPAIVFILIAFPTSDTIHEFMIGRVAGNYFLMVLFLTTSFITILMAFVKGSRKRNALVLLAMALICDVLATLFSAEGPQPLHWKAAIGNFQFVAAGMIAAMWAEPFLRRLCRPAGVLASSALCIGLAACLLFFAEDSAAYKALYRVAVPFAGIAMCFAWFGCMKNVFRPGRRSAVWAEYIGRRSLPIYVLSWLWFRVAVLSGFNTLFIGSLWQLFAFFAIVTACSLASHDVLCRIPGVERWIFGRNRPLETLPELFRRHNMSHNAAKSVAV